MINVLLADTQALTREGTAALLADISDISIIGTATSPAELEQMIIMFKPRVVIIDHHDQLSIKQIPFDVSHILVVSNNQNRNEIQELIDLGIKNYISKECQPGELIDAIYATARGEEFYCGKTSKMLFDTKAQLEQLGDIPNLSVREMEIVRLIADGLTNNEISEKLFISVHTIKTHRKNIIKKLGFTFKNASEFIAQLKMLS